MKTITMTWTADEFYEILKLVTCGDHVINSGYQEPDPGTDAVIGKIYDTAKTAGFKEWVRPHEDGTLIAGPALESSVSDAVQDYEDESFWDQIVYRLSLRDLVKRYGQARVDAMEWAEREAERERFEQRYWDEFQKNGVDNLDVRDEGPKLKFLA